MAHRPEEWTLHLALILVLVQENPAFLFFFGSEACVLCTALFVLCTAVPQYQGLLTGQLWPSFLAQLS